MIAHKLTQEKETLLHYANLLNDHTAKQIIERDGVRDKAEAKHLAQFFWRVARASNDENKKTGQSSRLRVGPSIRWSMRYS